MLKRATWTAAAAAILVVVLAGPAPAHQGHEGELPVIDGISPAVDGVQVRIVTGGLGKLALSTTGSTTAQVLGTAGQPILRVGPKGVEANAASPEWYQDNEPLGIAQVPASAKPDAPARWVRVSTERYWEWFDHRLHKAGPRVDRWSVPLVVNGAKAEIRGHIVTVAATLEVRPEGSAPDGVTVTGINKPNSVQLVNGGDSPVSVLGPDGEVFARIGPDGTSVNVHSPAWLATAQYQNRDLLTSVIDPEAKPEFLLLSQQAELIWPDPRLAPRGSLVEEVSGLREPVEVGTWSIPVVTGGKRESIGGATLLTPGSGEEDPPGGGGPPVAASDDGGFLSSGLTIFLAIAATLAVIGGAVLVVRSRS